MCKPTIGTCILFRVRGTAPYKFGYVNVCNNGMLHITDANGATFGGAWYDPADIEWKEYKRA